MTLRLFPLSLLVRCAGCATLSDARLGEIKIANLCPRQARRGTARASAERRNAGPPNGGGRGKSIRRSYAPDGLDRHSHETRRRFSFYGSLKPFLPFGKTKGRNGFRFVPLTPLARYQKGRAKRPPLYCIHYCSICSMTKASTISPSLMSLYFSKLRPHS